MIVLLGCLLGEISHISLDADTSEIYDDSTRGVKLATRGQYLKILKLVTYNIQLYVRLSRDGEYSQS